MITNPHTPQSWGIQLSKLWGPNFPVEANQLAREYTSTASPFRTEPIRKVEGHSIDGFEGMLVQREQQSCWYILYDQRVALPGRRNFTVAHELGHYLLHRESAQEFRCKQRDVVDYGSEASRKREGEANTFASYLLMPISDFREQTANTAISFDLLGHCADRYKVSLTAAALKWLEFTDDTALFVVSRDGFVLWSKPSDSARKKGYYRRSGSPIPSQSLAGLATHFNADERQGIAIPAGAWHPEQETREMIIVSDQFEFSISLVLFARSSHSFDFDEDSTIDAFDRVMQPFERQ